MNTKHFFRATLDANILLTTMMATERTAAFHDRQRFIESVFSIRNDAEAYHVTDDKFWAYYAQVTLDDELETLDENYGWLSAHYYFNPFIDSLADMLTAGETRNMVTDILAEFFAELYAQIRPS